MIRPALLLLGLFLPFTHALAQQPRQFSFKRFSVAEGLAANSVYKVVQDRDGYMWLATSNGLQRYDGNSFITFRPKPGDSTSAPDVKIALLYLDRNNNLWLMGDNRRVGIFNTRTYRFSEVSLPGNRSALYICQGFFELPGGELLLLKSDGNFLRYRAAEKKFVEDKNLIPAPPGWTRQWIHWDALFQKCWIACDSGLVQYDPITKHINYRGHNTDNDPVIKGFEKQLAPDKLFTDTAGNLVFVNWPYHAAAPLIYRYNRRAKRAEELYSGHNGYHEINYFLQQRNGKLWVYGNPFLAEWSERNGKTLFEHVPNEYTGEHSIRFDYLYDVYEDKEDNMWLGTDNGLHIFNPGKQAFNTYHLAGAGGKPPMEMPVQCMAQLKDGRIFAGSWGSGGVTCYDKDFKQLPLPPFPKGEISTWDMTVHPKTGDLWIAMQAGSVVVYNVKQHTFKRFEPGIFNASTIRQVEEDTSGNMWFGTQNGRVIKWDYRKSGGDPSKGYELVYVGGLVHKLHYDYRGYIWIAGLHRGLTVLDALTGKQVRTFTTESPAGERLFTDDPTDMTYYNDSILLVTAGCLNIINTRTNKVTYIDDGNGLPANTTVSIEKDKNGTVWVGMINGLCRVNIEKKLVTYYDRRDGISNDKFNIAGVTEFMDGRLAFFTDRNFMVFDPAKFNQASMPPPPVISSFNLAGRPLNTDSINGTGGVVLKYNNTSVSIGFTALSYLPQNKLLYYYMLEGVDAEWKRSDKPMEAVYNNLAPGNYIFKVKTESADGLSGPRIAALAIDVTPPFWKTWWLLSLLSLLVVVVLYTIDKERMRKRKAIHQLRNQIRQNLKEEVSSTLSGIHVLSEMAKIKADCNIEMAKGFIGQISEKSRSINEVMNDTLWSIDPENDSMLHTIARMREWSEEISLHTGTVIDFSADDRLQLLKPDMRVRHDLYLLYKDAVSFMVTGLKASRLFVNWELNKGKTRLEIIAETANILPPAVTLQAEEHMEKRLRSLEAVADVLAERKNISVVLHLPRW